MGSVNLFFEKNIIKERIYVLKEGTRLYINLTNKCNTDCPFCCMYSGSDKKNFITFSQYKNIIDNCNTMFELQLEGGEPLLHKDIFLFIEYAIYTNRCNKIIILTNGILLEKYLTRFIGIANWYNIPIEIKVSVNYWLIEKANENNKNLFEQMNYWVFSTEFIPNINILFNVRKRKHKDEWIEEELKKYDLFNKSNIFFLQSYGKLKNSNYDKPIIVQNIKNWRIYASDGTCFEQDLIARSEFENNK